MDHFEIYTDGSSKIGKGKSFYESSSAVVIYLDGEQIFRCGCYHKDGTNSLGELYAMLLGLTKVDEIISDHEFNDPHVSIYADSDYVVKSLTTYIKTWSKCGLNNTWMSYSTKEEVKYQSIFKYIYKHYLKKTRTETAKYGDQPFPVEFFHINSHIHKLRSDKDLRKARFNFMKRNEVDISLEDFEMHSERNDEVDALAEVIRAGKIYYFEEGDERWVRKSTNMLTRKGRAVIRRRNSSKN